MPKQRDPNARDILDMNAFRVSAADGVVNNKVIRRQQNLGPLSVLFYQQPIEMESADGCWMTATDGTRYLDLYNNVPSVGHCHPHIVAAIAEQATKLNTNTRYLNDRVDRYLERLKATLPDYLDTIALSNSGSEANDLALRVAQKATRRKGFVVTETAYHGNTAAVAGVSPASLKRGRIPDHVRVVPAPSRRNYGDDIIARFAFDVRRAIASLAFSPYGFAGMIADSIFSSDGVFAKPNGLLRPVINAVHAAGGVFIADEVQSGFARVGESFWGFQRHKIQPDIVTMGKPMGNGFPIAGLAANSRLLEPASRKTGYFATFGGNTVAVAAGNAVLDVIESEQLMQNACEVGAFLLRELSALVNRHTVISEVRGAGLYLGIELCRNDADIALAAQLTSRVIELLRENGILVGACGRYGNILKIRPPLCLAREEAARFVKKLDAILATM